MEKPNIKSAACKILNILLLVILTIQMQGCYSTAYISQDKLSLLKEHQITRAEILKLIGKPLRTVNNVDCGGEILTYDSVHMGMFSDKMEQQTVNLLIADTGILEKISVNERTVKLSNFSQIIEHEKLSLLESKVNIATKAEVIELIGHPDWIAFGQGGRGEILMFFRSKTEESLADITYDIATAGLLRTAIYEDYTTDEQQQISLFVDDEGILRKIAISDKPTKMRGGILAK